MTEYFDNEMARLEKQQVDLRKRKEASDRDRYNTNDERNVSIHDYERIVNAKISLAPSTGELLSDYIKKIIIYQGIAKTKNWDTHVDNPYKTWRTHKIPVGCFMCEDMAFIGVLVQVLQVINKRNSNIKF